jgi:hypothetical protein
MWDFLTTDLWIFQVWQIPLFILLVVLIWFFLRLRKQQM